MSKQRLQQLQTCCLHTRDAQQHRCCNHAAASKLRRQRTHCTQVSIPVGRDTLVPAQSRNKQISATAASQKLVRGSFCVIRKRGITMKREPRMCAARNMAN